MQVQNMQRICAYKQYAPTIVPDGKVFNDCSEMVERYTCHVQTFPYSVGHCYDQCGTHSALLQLPCACRLSKVKQKGFILWKKSTDFCWVLIIMVFYWIVLQSVTSVDKKIKHSTGYSYSDVYDLSPNRTIEINQWRTCMSVWCCILSPWQYLGRSYSTTF